MSNHPYQIGNIQYWKDGDTERFDPNSLAFKKAVYGSYPATSIMSDKDSQKSGIQLKLNPNDVTLSKEDALNEKNKINSFEGYFGSQFGKSGTWSSRNSRQQKAQAYRRLEDIDYRKNTINSILSNPVNIERWANEEQLIQEEEEERLLQIQLEEKKIQDEINRKENLRLMAIEKKEIIKVSPVITPEIIPTVVATSSLLPLGIIALLLYSRTGKK